MEKFILKAIYICLGFFLSAPIFADGSLLDSILNEDIDGCRQALASGESLSAPLLYGDNALSVAIRNKKFKVVNWILYEKHIVEVNPSNKKNCAVSEKTKLLRRSCTAMSGERSSSIISSSDSSTETPHVRKSSSRSLSLNSCNRKDSGDSSKCVKFASSATLTISITDILLTPLRDASNYLHLAAQASGPEMLELIFNALPEDLRQAYINQRNGVGYTPLHVAALNGNLENFNWLVAHGADPNQAGEATPNQLAALLMPQAPVVNHNGPVNTNNHVHMINIEAELQHVQDEFYSSAGDESEKKERKSKKKKRKDSSKIVRNSMGNGAHGS